MLQKPSTVPVPSTRGKALALQAIDESAGERGDNGSNKDIIIYNDNTASL